MHRRNASLFCVLTTGVLLAILMCSGTAWADKPTLMAQWKLDDGFGGEAKDSSGNGYHGEFDNRAAGLGTGGSVWYEDADHGTVASFDGSNYIDPGVMLPEMTLANNFTWAFWAKMDASNPGTTHVIAGNRYGGTSSPLQFIKFTPSSFEYYYDSTNYGLDYEDLEVDVWMHHVVVKAGDTLSYYRDGALSMTDTVTVTLDENPFYIGGDTQGEQWAGFLSDIRLYVGALTADEIRLVMAGEDLNIAADPSPATDAVDVAHDVIISWTGSDDAVAHDVYFGTSADDVNTASRSNPLDVLVAEGQTETDYSLGLLEFGQTYYWRVDEVAGNGAVHTGSLWNFTVEALTYAVADITATATGTSEEGEGPENTVNGSGLDADDYHGTLSSDMWLSTPTGDEPIQIQYAFDKAYCLYEMLIWNYNVPVEAIAGFGAKNVTVDYSLDGVEWTTLSEMEFAQGTSKGGYAANTTVDFNGVQVQYVRLTINSNWGMFNSYGLSEVRFLCLPMRARLPEPAVGGTDLNPELTLSWRAGRQADLHNVYIDTDEQAVIDGTTAFATTFETSYDVAVDLAQTYYWRVDEVNEVEEPAVWGGTVWTLSTTTSLAIDDFESYTDDEGSRIYEFWEDGFLNDTGSTVGYIESPFAETTRAYSGEQSMPLAYANTGGFTTSAAVRTFDAAQDWSAYGIKSLSLMFMGDPKNTTGQLYVEINGTKIAYDGNADDLQVGVWMPWVIDLTGLNVQSIDALTIGVDGAGAAGILYIDTIRVYPYEAEMVTPVTPDTESLVAYYPLEGDATDAAGDHDGTIFGTPNFVTGVEGQAINVSGSTGEITVAYADDLALDSFTVAAWVNIDSLDSSRGILGTRFNGDNTFDLKVESTRIHADVGSGSAWLNTNVDIDAAHGGILDTDEWYHIVYAMDATGTVTMYLNGVLAATLELGGTPLLMKSSQELHIGNSSGSEYMHGLIDEVRIYNRVLSKAEVAGLAGRSVPSYSSF